MMQLLCNGVLLELYSNTGVQFTHSNPLFAFDSLECERTTAFKIPATPKNETVFGLARIPSYDGAGMRRKLNAQLQAGTVVKNGYLYVSQFDGKDYNAIFVTGEYIGLQQIRDAGKINDIIGDVELLAYWTNPLSYAQSDDFATVRYNQYYGSNKCVPSIRLKYLIETAMQRIGATCPTISGAIRVLIGNPKTASGEVTFSNTSDGSWSSSYSTTTNMNTITTPNSGSAGAIFSTTRHKIRARANNTPAYAYGWVRQLYCATHDVQLTFPSDMATGWFLMSFPQNAAQDPNNDPDIYKEEISPGVFGTIACTIGLFLGDYSFAVDWSTGVKTASGEPLAGRTVTIPRGTPFVLLNWFEFDTYTSGWNGWNTVSNSTDLTFILEEDDAQPGAKIPLYGNMPDVTLVDLLKTYAALAGNVLTYSSASGVQFDSVAISTWTDVVDITDSLIAIKKVARTFADYAQRNIVKFAGDETQLQSDKITRVYSIDNDNIEPEDVLQEIPFSEGSESVKTDNILVRNTEEDVAPQGFVIGATHGDNVLHRVSLPTNSGITTLCTKSTQVDVTARMTQEVYDMLAEHTIIMLRGSRYVWTAKKWNNNIAQLTLAMV